MIFNFISVQIYTYKIPIFVKVVRPKLFIKINHNYVVRHLYIFTSSLYLAKVFKFSEKLLLAINTEKIFIFLYIQYNKVVYAKYFKHYINKFIDILILFLIFYAVYLNSVSYKRIVQNIL